MPQPPASQPTNAEDGPRTAFLGLVDAARDQDWTALFLNYHITRTLRDIRDHVGRCGWPGSFEIRLRLTLVPYLVHDARQAGTDWTIPGPLQGPLAPLFEIDARLMNDGCARAALPPAAFERYVAQAHALFAEFSAIRARMHNGDA